MSNNAANIKKNLERLLKEREWRVVDLENKAKKGRVVHNIIHGTTNNPRIDILKSLADALNVDIEEFLHEDDKEENVNLTLLLDTCKKVIVEITPICDKYTIKPNNILKLIREVYKYSMDLNLTHADNIHIKWLIQQHYKK
ncbi:helix-turn-helix transcriptional regulator [Candidatus Tisiphia endosymbiont of Ditula angustiorana]|uniref:helix-turn-helix domain-containing protein n=1 Tax=unclassified Candidatus Tisiphia TaxID=2996318 RepID=UPI00312C96A9